MQLFDSVYYPNIHLPELGYYSSSIQVPIQFRPGSIFYTNPYRFLGQSFQELIMSCKQLKSVNYEMFYYGCLIIFLHSSSSFEQPYL